MSERHMLSYRNDFPIFKSKKSLIYLDSAATMQKPSAVIDAMSTFYKNHYGTVHRAIYDLSQYASHEYEAVRGKVRSLLNALKNEEIIFTRL